MKHIYRLFIVLLIFASLLAACGSKSTSVEKIEPYQLEVIEGSDFQRVILTEKAAQRLDIQTAPMGAGNVIPYAAVLYGLNGETWTYTNPEPLVFVRQPIVIDHIDGDMVVLSEGPDAGTAVVIIGVAELYGAEVGVKK
jgi:hypothetical protein